MRSRFRPAALAILITLAAMAIVAGVLAATLSAANPGSATPATTTPRTTTSRTGGVTTTTAPTRCLMTIAGWSTPRLLAQLLLLTGTFTHPATLAPAAAAGVGALEMAFAPGVEPRTTPATATRVKDVIASLVSDATSAGQVAPIISTDAEGGDVTRLAGVLGAIPSPREMAATWTPTQVEQEMETRGREMKTFGIGMDTGPVYTTASPATTQSYAGSRSFSTTPTTAAVYANAFARGLATAGLLAVAKHFPSEGHANANTDTAVAVDPPIATLRTHDLVAFAKAVEAKVPVVMVGHPVVPGLTDGLPASLSPATYALLDTTLGFTGLTITDTLGVKAISIPGYTVPEAVVRAVEAGADMPMLRASTWSSALDALEHAVATHALSMLTVRTRVAHVLDTKGICDRSR